MNRINNKKLDYLVDKIYDKNLNIRYTSSILNTIQNNKFCQKDNLFKFQQRRNKPNYFKDIFKNLKLCKNKKDFSKISQLENTYNKPEININEEKLKSIKIKEVIQNLDEQKVIKNTKCRSKIDNNINTNGRSKIDNNINTNGRSKKDNNNINDTKDRSKKESIPENIIKCCDEQDIQNSRLFTIKNENNGDLIIEINHIDYMLIAICIILFENFSCISDKEKYNFIKDLKYKMAIDLDKENLYEKYNYRHKRFKKTDLQNSLIENDRVLHKFFYNYLADYFSINLIEIDDKICKYINSYNKLRYSILIYKNQNKYHIRYRNNYESLKENEFLSKHYILKKKKKNNINKLKLAELQNMAISKGIDIKKMGKKQKINKTKSELINEIFP